MTTIDSCDHHDERGLVPSNRSRARMLEQLRRAEAFAELFLEMTRGSGLSLVLTRGNEPIRATITLDLGKFLETWQALMAWHAERPDGDDWAPPFERGSEIRVPPDGVAVE